MFKIICIFNLCENEFFRNDSPKRAAFGVTKKKKKNVQRNKDKREVSNDGCGTVVKQPLIGYIKMFGN